VSGTGDEYNVNDSNVSYVCELFFDESRLFTTGAGISRK
jgi:hypothetical protein